MQLTEDVLRTFGMGRVFKVSRSGPWSTCADDIECDVRLAERIQNYQGHINSLDFHRSEDLLVTAGDDDAIRLYNTQNGTEVKQLFSKKHGVCNICYTHAPQAVVYASNKVKERYARIAALHALSSCTMLIIAAKQVHDSAMQGNENTLRYLSLHDNRYLRYFKGHSEQVTTLCLSPKSDLFMSAALVRKHLHAAPHSHIIRGNLQAIFCSPAAEICRLFKATACELVQIRMLQLYCPDSVVHAC